jgi:hypothetical protein
VIEKNPGPKNPALGCPLRELQCSLLSYGSLLEWWSNGIMKGPIQIEIRAFAFSNTPILQYSSTPKTLAIFTGKAIEP